MSRARSRVLAALVVTMLGCGDPPRRAPVAASSATEGRASTQAPATSSGSARTSAPSSASSSASSSSSPAGDAGATSRGPGRVEEHTFASTSLGVTKRYEVYLPGGYGASAKRYPVVVMLHGLGGNETNWIEHGDLAHTADALGLEAIVVMPDGDASFYVDSATSEGFDACSKEPSRPFNGHEAAATYCVKSPRYESYVVKDLLAEVDARFRTIADKGARGIGGLSMGGFGALALAMRHPDVFGAVASHSGLASLLYDGPHPFVSGKVTRAESPDAWGKRYPEKMRALVRGIFGPSIATWKAYDPALLAAKLSPGELQIYLDCGTEDDFGFQDLASDLHEILAARGVEHTFALVPGHHLFDLWKARLPESLRFFARALAKPR